MYVYFIEETGTITAIKRTKEDEPGKTVLWVDNNYLTKFVDTSKLQKYKVVWNKKLEQYDIIEKAKEISRNITISDSIHMLEENAEAEILFVVNKKEKTITCRLSDSFKEEINNSDKKYDNKNFVIYSVQQNNPNIIYSEYKFSLFNALNDISHTYDLHTIHCDFVIKKFFDNYGITYE